MTLITVVFLAYLLLVMVVGAVAARYGRTMEGYFLADRGLGAWVTAISSVASSESGWLVLGLVGMAYAWGAQAVWTVPGVLVGYLCNWFLVAPRLRQHSEALGAITIPDFLEARLGDRWKLLRATGIAIILFCLMFYVSAQFTATGKAFHKAFGAAYGITYSHGVLIGGLITIVYTLIGGFRAVSWTDLAQGLLMVFGLIVLPWVTVASIGGFGVLFDRLEQAPQRTEAVMTRVRGTSVEQIGVEEEPRTIAPGVVLRRQGAQEDSYRFLLEVSSSSAETPPQVQLNGEPVGGIKQLAPGDRIETREGQVTFDKTVEMIGGRSLTDALGGRPLLGLLGWVIGLLGIGFGYPGQPHVLARYMAARSRGALLRGRLIAIVWGCLALYGAVILGLAARVAVPDLVDPEQAYPSLATTHLPPILGGVLLAAIISAMMSTADSQLLVVSSAVSRDLIDKGFNIRTRLSSATLERRLAWITRATVLLIGVVSLILALAQVRAIFWFVLFAWSGLGAGFGPPILMALFWRRVTLWGAFAGMITGIAITILWKVVLKAVVEEATGLSLYELVPAFLLSLLVTWLVSVLTPTPRSLPPGLEGLTTPAGDR
jgi:Na+/proline symporter